MEYGIRIKKARKALNKNQKEFANDIKISQQSLSRIETNETEIGIECLSRIQNIGINAQWILTGEGSMFLSNDELESKMTPIPLVDISASAGTGIINFDANVENFFLDRKFLQGYQPKELFLVRARGNSMLPTIQDGDLLIVHRIESPRLGYDGLCVIMFDGACSVKDIQILPDKVLIMPRNPEFENMTIYPDDCESKNFQVLGEVVGIMRSL